MRSSLSWIVLRLSEVKWGDYVSLNIKYPRGKTNIKHLSFHCSQVAHLSLIISRGKTVTSGLLGVIWGLVPAVGDGAGYTYRMRTALSPLKAPSVMWLMELWPRRRAWRSPSTARLPSSRRVKLLYDRFLEREIEREADRKEDGGRHRDGERKRGGKRRGKKEKCSVWGLEGDDRLARRWGSSRHHYT